MPVFTRQILSESADGQPVGVTATAAGGGRLLHQVQATATNVFELVTLWINNGSTTVNADPILEVTNGASSLEMQTRVNTQAGNVRAPKLVLNQLPLSGTDSAIHAYATEGVTFFAWGHVDRIATG